MSHKPFLRLPSIYAGPSLITSLMTMWPSFSAMVIPRPRAGSLRRRTSLAPGGQGGVASSAPALWSLPAEREREEGRGGRKGGRRGGRRGEEGVGVCTCT